MAGGYGGDDDDGKRVRSQFRSFAELRISGRRAAHKGRRSYVCTCTSGKRDDRLKKAAMLGFGACESGFFMVRERERTSTRSPHLWSRPDGVFRAHGRCKLDAWHGHVGHRYARLGLWHRHCGHGCCRHGHRRDCGGGGSDVELVVRSLPHLTLEAPGASYANLGRHRLLELRT